MKTFMSLINGLLIGFLIGGAIIGILCGCDKDYYKQWKRIAEKCK